MDFCLAFTSFKLCLVDLCFLYLVDPLRSQTIKWDHELLRVQNKPSHPTPKRLVNFKELYN